MIADELYDSSRFEKKFGSICHFPTARIHAMKFKRQLLCGLFILILTGSSCVSGPNVNRDSTPTASPCATAFTLPAGQTTFATLSPNQPTFSPEMQATAEARLRQANPGNPPNPAVGPSASQLPPCPTQTPLPTPRPQTPTGGMAQDMRAPAPASLP